MHVIEIQGIGILEAQLCFGCINRSSRKPVWDVCCREHRVCTCLWSAILCHDITPESIVVPSRLVFSYAHFAFLNRSDVPSASRHALRFCFPLYRWCPVRKLVHESLAKSVLVFVAVTRLGCVECGQQGNSKVARFGNFAQALTTQGGGWSAVVG